MSRNILPCVLVVSVMSACAPSGMYEWGSYEANLYAYYEDPEKADDLMTALERAIASGENSKRVPPGIFAEYGYLLLADDQGARAIEYFEKEKAAWPESAVLMDKLIGLAQDPNKRAGAAEGTNTEEQAKQ